MHRRAFLLLALLAVVTLGGFHLRTRSTPSGPPGIAQHAIQRTPAPDPPKHSRIEDGAAILAPFVPRLGATADAFFTDLGIDVRVVTRQDTGSSIDAQANALFERKQIGREAPVGGLLIVLNPRMASARIEVGYTLEGALTDLHMGRIARDQLAPYVSYGAAGMAVMDVMHYLRDHVYLSAALGRLSLPEELRGARAYREYERFLSGGAGAKTKLSALPIDSDLKAAVPRELRPLYAPAPEVQESVEAFLRATADLAGDPTLDLFTEGSRLMRQYYPVAPFEALRRLERIEASRPLQYLVQEDYAVATSQRPAQGFAPILLHREGGLWRIDLVETWKNLFFDKDGSYFLRNSNTPYAFGLKQFGSGRGFDMGAVPLRGVSLQRWLQALDRDDDPVASLWRAELWLRNAFVFPQAMLEYETARRLAPHDPWVLETFARRAQYLGFPELAIPAMEAIGRGLEMPIVDACNEAGDLQGARRWIERALEQNPRDLHALQWKLHLATREADEDEAQRMRAAISKLLQDPQRPDLPVVLYFHPGSPRFEPDAPMTVDGTTLFDHSKFGVTLQNTSKRPVEIESVTLTSLGNARSSGLGDIKNYWHYPQGHARLGAGEHAYFEKQWGFTVDTGHRHVRYVFHTCWRGLGTHVRQCRTQWVDTTPYIPNPQ